MHFFSIVKLIISPESYNEIFHESPSKGNLI